MNVIGTIILVVVQYSTVVCAVFFVLSSVFALSTYCCMYNNPNDENQSIFLQIERDRTEQNKSYTVRVAGTCITVCCLSVVSAVVVAIMPSCEPNEKKSGKTIHTTKKFTRNKNKTRTFDLHKNVNKCN